MRPDHGMSVTGIDVPLIFGKRGVWVRVDSAAVSGKCFVNQISRKMSITETRAISNSVSSLFFFDACGRGISPVFPQITQI